MKIFSSKKLIGMSYLLPYRKLPPNLMTYRNDHFICLLLYVLAVRAGLNWEALPLVLPMVTYEAAVNR